MKRRRFVSAAALMLPGAAFGRIFTARGPGRASGTQDPGVTRGAQSARMEGGAGPVIVSTWNFKGANEAAYEVLRGGAAPLEAVEAGIRVAEGDASNTSVGIGGYPDRDGHLTLDASIMEGTGRCGSVAFVEGVDHPISLARLVMERSPHVMLAGQGAEQFAAEQGYTIRKTLTPGAQEAWEAWLRSTGYRPVPLGVENHDTIGLLALRGGAMAGGCSTSGAAWKTHGRVGDSPIIGAGLFVDDAVGAATSTGLGETVIRIAGSALVVELMRQGKTPAEACRDAIGRLAEKHPQYRSEKGFLAAFLALDKNGEAGAYAFGPGFEYTVMRDGKKTIVTPEYLKTE